MCSELISGFRLNKLVSIPLKLLPRNLVVPILSGALKGQKWIVGAAIHRCWLGFYEHSKQQLIVREVRKNTVFWDVGANVGFYTLLAAKLVGSGKVFAFEPVPRNCSYLRRHLQLNEVHNVEVLPLAVSDANGISSFQVEETGFMGHLCEDGSVSVSTATLDRLIEDGRLLPPDYVKMDIEGAELLALRGATRTFQRFRPILFLATHGRQIERECYQLLESWGYECIPIKHAGDLGELVARYKGRTESDNKTQIGNAAP